MFIIATIGSLWGYLNKPFGNLGFPRSNCALLVAPLFCHIFLFMELLFTHNITLDGLFLFLLFLFILYVSTCSLNFVCDVWMRCLNFIFWMWTSLHGSLNLPFFLLNPCAPLGTCFAFQFFMKFSIFDLQIGL